MDSQVRHDLEKNELAHLLGKGTRRLGSYWPHILVALLVLGVGLAAFVMYRSSLRSKVAEAWANFHKAASVADLEQVLADYPATDVVPYVKSRLAWIKLEQGKNQIVDNRDEALKSLEQAEGLFQEVIDQPSAAKELLPLAKLGQAMTKETACDVSGAKALYQQISEEYQGQPVGQVALGKLQTLETPEAAEFYAVLDKYRYTPSVDLPPPPPEDLFEPKGPIGVGPFEGLPGAVPPGLDSAPVPGTAVPEPQESSEATPSDAEPSAASVESSEAAPSQPAQDEPKRDDSAPPEPAPAAPTPSDPAPAEPTPPPSTP